MILRTKLYAPPARAELTQRPRLMVLLDKGFSAHAKLTLISAPAGYGKTTLVTAWLARHAESEEQAPHFQSAWLSLDTDDNDPARFVTYWLAALQSADPSLGQKAAELLAMSPLPPLTAIVGELLNDLLARESPLVLVLDDYHVISNPQVHEALATFITHQPGSMHIVLTTREDPPLSLARLRARGQLTEIRAQELRFTVEETREFLEASMGLDLDADAIATLEARTEGWAVGLQLAALALEHMSDRRHFLENFGGSHRYILDYLAEEVLRQQDKTTRCFLTRTAILDRLCAPLCDVVCAPYGDPALEDEESAPSPSADTVLHKLEKANLFLIPLDGERRWYRYHHLFADYLRVGLADAERAILYKRAAAWHEANHLQAEAVRYALRSDDAEFAADVTARTLQQAATWSGGNLAEWLGWLDVLPRRVFTSRPQLSLDASRILYLSGRLGKAEERLVDAEEALGSQPATQERAQMLALVALYRGAIAAVRGNAERAIALITFAQPRLPQEDHLVHARALFSLGMAYGAADQTAAAAEAYLHASEKAQAAGVLFLAIHGLCAAAQMHIKQGRLGLATQKCRAAISLTDGSPSPPLGLAQSLRGGIALERNDLVSAEALLEEGIALSRQGGLLDDVAVGLVFLARLRAYQGKASAAFEIVQEAQAIMHGYNVPQIDALAGAHRARLHMILGETAAAARWAAEVRSIRAQAPHDYVDLTLAWVLLATGEAEAVPSLLHPLLKTATAADQMPTVIEGLILLALAYDTEGKRAMARQHLMQALTLAAPEGYARAFLDQGQALHALLSGARVAAPTFVDTLLEATPPEDEARAAALAQLPEPLTEQETNVLDLLVAGKTNREIADALTITLGTAKWHVHNVLQKLNVNNRAQVIARAHELGLA